jgi:hypothetical protein
MRFNHLCLHKGIVGDDCPRLRFVLDIKNVQGTLIVEERTSHDQLPGKE